jgi:hypothetical protein
MPQTAAFGVATAIQSFAIDSTASRVPGSQSVVFDIICLLGFVLYLLGYFCPKMTYSCQRMSCFCQKMGETDKKAGI